MKEAVIVIDMLKDFVYGTLRTDRVDRVIPGLQRLLKAARKAGIPVVYVGDAHLPTDPEMRVWGEHAMKGTPGAETIEELKPEPGDYVLEKRNYSAFYETGLDLLLRTLGVESVVITGLHTHCCCRHTAADAFQRGYHIRVPEDCVDAFTEQDHQSGLAYLQSIYGAAITDSESLVREYEAHPAAGQREK